MPHYKCCLCPNKKRITEKKVRRIGESNFIPLFNEYVKIHNLGPFEGNEAICGSHHTEVLNNSNYLFQIGYVNIGNNIIVIVNRYEDLKSEHR